MSVSPWGDSAILRGMPLRTANPLRRIGVQPAVHRTAGCRTRCGLSSAPPPPTKTRGPPFGGPLVFVGGAGSITSTLQLIDSIIVFFTELRLLPPMLPPRVVGHSFTPTLRNCDTPLFPRRLEILRGTPREAVASKPKRQACHCHTRPGAHQVAVSQGHFDAPLQPPLGCRDC